jgi:hypothetical protein
VTDDPEGGQPPSPLSTPTRNRYFFGRLLTAEDLAQEQAYLATKRRLANRLLHGWGVVAGLDVTVTDRSSVTVSPGVALDGWGREIVVVTATTEPIPADAGAGPLEVVVCYAEEEGEPVPVPGPDDAAAEATIIREVPRVEVRPATAAAAATDPPPADWTELVRWITRRPDAIALPPDPSVLLARLDLDADEAIEAVDIDVRAVVPGNALLLQVLRGAD